MVLGSPADKGSTGKINPPPPYFELILKNKDGGVLCLKGTLKGSRNNTYMYCRSAMVKGTVKHACQRSAIARFKIRIFLKVKTKNLNSRYWLARVKHR